MVHFSNNTPRNTQAALCNLMSMTECTHTGMYLGNPFYKFSSKTEAFRHVIVKLANKLVGWKINFLSMAGRTTLVKVIAMAIPSFVMQSFILPKRMCEKIDNMVFTFWWGFTEPGKHLYLKAWDNLCVPKTLGGLGFQKFKDINRAFVTKLGWRMCAETSKTWVQLIRSRYLKGRRVLDFQHSGKPASWIWAGIRACHDSLRKGLCCRVGQNSTIHIYEDPWLPDTPSFLMPVEVQPANSLFHFQNLMQSDGSSWDPDIITAHFPPPICRLILNTPISQGEQDAFVWIPSTSGKFSVQSAYNVNMAHRFHLSHGVDKRIWQLLWKSSLHERHKILLWKLLVDIISTKDRIKQFVPLSELHCYVCDQATETLHHLLLECPLAKLCWWNSHWTIRLTNFSHLSVSDWISYVLDPKSVFLHNRTSLDQDRFGHFLAISF